MANCKICGEPAGFADEHLRCRERIDAGKTIEEIRAASLERLRGSKQERLQEAIEAVRLAAGWLFLLFPVLGAAAAVTLLGAKEDSAVLLAIAAGVVCGVLIAWVIHAWLKLQAALAERIVAYLDDRDGECR